MTHGTVCDTEEAEEHVLVASRCDFRHHSLCICIIRGLEESKQNIVYPEIADVVIAHPLGPEAQHAIEWDEDGEEVGDHEHMLSLQTEVFLNIPKAKSRSD